MGYDLPGSGLLFPAVAVDAGGAVHVGLAFYSVFLESGRYTYLSMIGAVLAQFLHTQHHFIVVAHAHGFYDVTFHVVAHGAVQSAKPVGLIREYARQREDDEYGNIFQR